MATTTETAPEALFARVQELQERLDGYSDGPVRALAEELTAALVAMYGEGLERIVDAVSEAGPDVAAQLAQRLGDDPVVATLLLIHDLHPVPLADRVQQALDSVRPYMESHGGNVELLSVQDGIARIHLRGSCSDCSASSVTLELAIKKALEEEAPDLLGLEVEGVAPPMTGSSLPMVTGSSHSRGSSGSSAMELPVVMSGSGPPAQPAARMEPDRPAPDWVELDTAATPELGTMAAITAGGGQLVVANVQGTLLAYHDRCAACGEPLHGGELTEGALACPSCRRSFFLPRAGRSLDDEQLQLEPVPLLHEQGRVKVAVGRV